MTANRIVSLAFGLIVTMSSGTLLSLMWIAGSVPSVTA